MKMTRSPGGPRRLYREQALLPQCWLVPTLRVGIPQRTLCVRPFGTRASQGLFVVQVLAPIREHIDRPSPPGSPLAGLSNSRRCTTRRATGRTACAARRRRTGTAGTLRGRRPAGRWNTRARRPFRLPVYGVGGCGGSWLRSGSRFHRSRRNTTRPWRVTPKFLSSMSPGKILAAASCADGQAIVFQRLAHLVLVGVFQVQVQRRHAPFGPAVTNQHRVAFHQTPWTAPRPAVPPGTPARTCSGKTKIGEFLGIGHAPDPVDALHQAVLLDHRGPVDVFDGGNGP